MVGVGVERRGECGNVDRYGALRNQFLLFTKGVDDTREKKAKTELSSLIQKQFALRNGGVTLASISATAAMERHVAKDCRVRAAEATSTKISGLTISKRESYLNLLINALEKNYSTLSSMDEDVAAKSLSKSDFIQCAVDLEYGIFSGNKVMTMYRRGVALKVC